MTAKARPRAPDGPGLRRANPRDAPSDDDASEHRAARLALVDELAVLAADLWFAGQLDLFPVHEEAADGDDE